MYWFFVLYYTIDKGSREATETLVINKTGEKEIKDEWHWITQSCYSFHFILWMTLIAN